jgi:hypothetical protein
MGNRKTQLKQVADAYFQALRDANFSLIPYDAQAVLRAPLTPGGIHAPLKGIADIHAQWWVPLAPALQGVEISVTDYFYNDREDAIVAKAEIHLPAAGIRLRVADAFTVSPEGNILEQENHFDASPLRPGDQG